ncbi:aromatic-ring-hydroxylating dioxygenase subunit beta [Ottowia thiooxydans]|uniref:3-phenylpropionate/cinnamic acid dioxygenase small subunit n=1 Tax=Ottowia thiooxydans TaxID=219182 RepID=A0ABV2Q3U9_9BURK
MSDIQDRIRDLVFLEAELLDDLELRPWLDLFTEDGIYWAPIDDAVPRSQSASLIYDDSMSRQERVHHLLQLPFPAQNPRSRTVHFVSNLRVTGTAPGFYKVRSSQLIVEARPGDYTQIGLGKVATYVAKVEHHIEEVEDTLKVKLKKILLINRDMPLGNLTFML